MNAGMFPSTGSAPCDSNMSRLKFCANISWLYTELPDLTQRICAAASDGFKAVEAAWPYDTKIEHIQRARNDNGVKVVLINTPPGRVQTAYFFTS